MLGIFAIVSPSFVHANEQVEAVVIHKQVADVYDVRDPNALITMRLLPDGTGVFVEEMSMPYFLKTQVAALYNGTCDENADMAKAFADNHTICVNALRKNPSRIYQEQVHLAIS